MALTLAAIQTVLLVTTGWDKSDTIDEPHYLATAVRQWNERTLRHNPDAPALPKWGFAMMLHVTDPPLFEGGTSGRHPLWSRPPEQMRRNLLAARSATIALTVVAGLVLAAAAHRYGFVAALVTQTLWCFSPTVLANGSLATLDGWVAAWLAVAIGAAACFVDRPTPWRAALVGATLALAAASKVTALGAIPVALVASLWLSVRRGTKPMRRTAGWWIAASAAFVLTLWAVSLFETGPIDLGRLTRSASTSATQSWGWAPFPTWILGLLLQVQHGQSGHLGYLFGQVSGAGWWWFYLAAAGSKTTVGAQFSWRSLAAWRRSRRPAVSCLPSMLAILAFPLLLLVVMSAGRTQIGIALSAAGVSVRDPLARPRAARLRRAVRTAGARVGRSRRPPGARRGRIPDRASASPDVLQRLGRWTRGRATLPDHRRRLGTGSAPAGRLERKQHPPALFYTLYSGDPPQWGITYEEPPCTPTPGHYALHAVEVHRPSGSAGLPGLAHRRASRRAPRLLDLHLPGHPRPNPTPRGRARAHRAVLRQRWETPVVSGRGSRYRGQTGPMTPSRARRSIS